MANKKSIPEHLKGRVVPHLVVDNAAEALDFYKKAFDANEAYRAPVPNGEKIMHAEFTVAGSTIYICDDFPEFGGKARSPKALGGSPFNLHFFVDDVDSAVAKAEAAGAEVTMKPEDTFWGDRYGKVRDPYGHEWSFATPIRDVSPEEMVEAAKKFFGGE